MIRNTIRWYYVFSSLVRLAFSFFMATYAIYLQKNGLDAFERNAVNVVFYVTIFLFEIPTGVIADRYGRKMSFFVSCVLLSVSTSVYGCSTTFVCFAVAEALCGIGRTCATGAFQAWLVDTLKGQRFRGSYTNIFSRSNAINEGCSALGCIVGAVGSEWILPFPWFAASFVLAITALLVWFYMSDDRVRVPFSLRGNIRDLIGITSKSLSYARKSKPVRFVLLIGVTQTFAMQAPNMQWTIFFNSTVSVTTLGLLSSVVVLAIALGSFLAPRILKYIGDERKAILMLQIGIGVAIAFSLVSSNFWFALILFMIHEVGRGAFRPIKDAYLNDNIPSTERATLISFESQFVHVGGIVGLLISGMLAKHLSFSVAWFVSGFVLVGLTLVFWRNGKQHQ